MFRQLKFSTLIVLILFANLYAEQRKSRLVRTASGPVKGYKDPNFDIFTFHGIPYATAPIGKDKFKAPLPGPVWQKTLKGVDRNVVCPQNKKYSTGKHMQEDCLIANVYVPDTNVTQLPVMVHVHGGAYQMGYGNMQTPKHLVQSRIIIAVNFYYRLSVHGFLCLGTKNIPGNAGMKDQVALLQWVKKNIASFGGNPNEVTLSGCSAGSSAVDLIMLSRITKGLFNKVLPQSGANIGVWSVQIDPLKLATDHAKKFKFNKTNNIQALENFYINSEYEQLTNEVALNHDNTFGFVPCVEPKSNEKMVFLHKAPVKILKSGDYKKVPILYGFSSKEGKFRRFRHEMYNKLSDFLPADLLFGKKESKEKVVRRLNKLYFYSDGKNISEGTAETCKTQAEINKCFDKKKKTDAYIDYFGDVLFAYPTLRAVKLHIEAGHDKIYLYEYSYGGGSHSAQTRALMDENDENLLPKEYIEVKAVVRNMCLNFITKGVPVPAGSKPLPVWLGMRRSLLQPRMSFWHSIYKKYYHPPAPPQTK